MLANITEPRNKIEHFDKKWTHPSDLINEANNKISSHRKTNRKPFRCNLWWSRFEKLVMVLAGKQNDVQARTSI